MTRCRSCGHENQDGSSFCSRCGRPVIEVTVGPREERKVITVLFADLVGFTSRSERLDPEDVRGFLSPYYARLRTELERFGGTVEKFIGDAVVALFGAPVVHEDDAERAVRAALAIRDWAVEQPGDLQMRIAVTTGEALITLHARPGEGEGMASGDVVNTASRLQAAAPVNGILVGELTHRLTQQTIEYRDAAPVVAKGKAEPVPAWEAVAARARVGADLSPARTAMVGRDHESALLAEAMARARRDRAPQLVTIVGVPGIGKSRLVAELFAQVEAEAGELVRWRQGRSLPYGEGVTFWALGEIVKAEAGILESDTLGQAEAKLRDAVAAVVPGAADAQWVEAQLRPLAGLGGAADQVRDAQGEAFTAWRRFLEALAEASPLVLVFEDVHWADALLLDFIEHLVDWATGVPLLVVCCTRPELLERRPAWSGGKRNATTLSLVPLSDDDTARLLGELTDRPVMDAQAQSALLARAGGNPLYAEQYARMLAEGGDPADPALPETIQGIIAARLDGLSDGEKSLLQDAAVVGKVFWPGALTAPAALARDEIETRLHALERKEFVRRFRRSSIADEVEYGFVHVLVSEVAYGQIPRASRAEKHRLAAAWLAGLGRPDDHAEMLAHHHLSALALLRAAGRPIDDELASAAVASLRSAGDRAMSLHAYASAATYYRAALELAPAASRQHAQLLLRIGRSQNRSGDVDPASLSAACAALRECGELEEAAEAELLLAEMLWLRGETDLALEHLGEARGLVEGRPDSVTAAHVIGSLGRFLMLADATTEALTASRQAMAAAERLGLEGLRAAALNNIGASRLDLRDPGGIDDLETAIAVAGAANEPYELCRAQINLAVALLELGDTRRSVTAWEEAVATAARFGQGDPARWLRGQGPVYMAILGRWDDALAMADAFIAECAAGAPHYLAPRSYAVRAVIRAGRGDTAAAVDDAERAVALARPTRDPQNIYAVLDTCADVLNECGRAEAAAELAAEHLDGIVSGQRGGSAVVTTHVLAWTMSAVGRGAELAAALEGSPEMTMPWAQAAVLVAKGDLEGAADICARIGAVIEEARDRLMLGRRLVDEDDRDGAAVQLNRALSVFRSAGAVRYIRDAEAELARATGRRPVDASSRPA